MNLEEFAEQVHEISMSKYQLSYIEENGKDEALTQAHKDNETPEEFVDWWAEKNDLDTMEDFLDTPTNFKKLPTQLKEKL